MRTVDDASKNCTRPDRATADVCNEIGDLRVELAAAVERARLDVRIAELRKRAAALREKGATLSSDVQGEMIARFTRGLLSVKDAALGLPLLVTAVFEAIGALCPAILFAVVEGGWGTSVRVQTRPEVLAASPADVTGPVIDFLDDCTEPRDDARGLGLGQLYGEYQSWCEGRGKGALTVREFTTDLDRERERPEMKHRAQVWRSVLRDWFGQQQGCDTCDASQVDKGACVMSDDVVLDGSGENVAGHRILDGTDLEIAYNLSGDDLVLRVNKGPCQIFRVKLVDACKEFSDTKLFNFNSVSPDFVFRIGDVREGLMSMGRMVELNAEQMAKLETTARALE